MNEHVWREAAAEARSYAERMQTQRLTELAVAIRTRRLHLRMTQAELAARSGVPQPHLSRLETRRAGMPTVTVLDRIAYALGVTFTAVFDDPDRSPPEHPQSLGAARTHRPLAAVRPRS
jgi:transcriptional regulator with XRE-family HTH domain